LENGLRFDGDTAVSLVSSFLEHSGNGLQPLQRGPSDRLFERTLNSQI